MKKIFSITIAGVLSGVLSSQEANSQYLKDGTEFDLQLNTITTAVPFLLIAPDSRSGAMGDAGVAISPDANSQHWNASKLAFIDEVSDEDAAISLGYSPWLKALVPDINLAYLSGYKVIDKYQAIGASLRYFSLGDITFTNTSGQTTRTFRPNEFAIDLSYSRRLSDYFSVGITGRYIYSNLTGGTPTQGGGETKPGQAVATDISAFFTKPDIRLGGKDATFSAGLVVSNIGNKMSYTSSAERDFLPANLRLGTALDLDLDEYNRIGFAVDFNKLLVPTPPIYKTDDSSGVPLTDSQGDYIVDAGKDPNRGVAAGIFGSFTDAPGFPLPDEDGNLQRDAEGNLVIQKGSKFREELREVNVSIGTEYWYSQQFAVRAGFFYEHPTKGDRQYLTLGAGVRYSVFALDFSYLVPFRQTNPLANTLRFTLKFSFGGGDESSEA